MPTRAPSDHSGHRLRWHYIYYVLAIFDLVTVVFSVSLSHTLISRISNIADMEGAWSRHLGRHYELQQLAQALSAPGNDVFQSGNVEQERSRFSEARQHFEQSLAAALAENSQSSVSAPHISLAPIYDLIATGAESLSSSAERVFANIQVGDKDAAAANMAQMDRHYGEITLAFGELNHLISEAHTAQTTRHRREAGSLRKYEYGAMAAIGIMVVCVTWYGHMTARRIRASDEAWQKANDALVTSEAQFRALAEGIPILICAVDAMGQTTYANHGWDTLTGEITTDILRHGWCSVVVEEDRIRCHHIFKQSIANRTPFELETRIRTRDGGHRWFFIRGNPGRTDREVVLNFILSFDDITERKDTEELLKATLQEHRELLSVLDQACIVSITDVAGRIIHVNERFIGLSQYTRDELVGQDHRLVNSGFHSRDFWKEMYQTLWRGGTWQADVKNRAKDGSEYWVHSTMKAFRDAEGKIAKVISIRNDITPLKQAMTELSDARNRALAATQAKSEFLANMSHEIRTPMTAILGFTDVLLDEISANPEHVEVTDKLRVIRRNGEHLLGLINDILDLSKIEAGKLAFHIEECSPSEIVEDVVTMMKTRAQEKGLTIELQGASRLPESIRTDPTRLRQILINLLGNAVKFTESGTVSLVVGMHESDPFKLQCEVIDSGIGIANERISEIFQPFSQADTSHTRRFGGTGLGLTISRKLANLLGGDVTLVRTEAGVGSHFRAAISVALPMSSDPPIGGLNPPIGVKAEKTGSQIEPRLPGLRVLLAEDSPDNQRLFSFLLKRTGAEVEIAENGEIAVREALAAGSSGRGFDLILMDIQMPVMDGIDAVDQLRRAGYSRPVVALTANAMSDVRDKCLQAGFDDYLTKPIDRNLLFTKVQYWGRSEKGAVKTP